MTTELLGHLAYKLNNAPIQHWPFPHIYVENVFPSDFYEQFVANLPPEGDYSQGKSNYKGRLFAAPTKVQLLDELATPEFAKIAMRPFLEHIQARFANSKASFYTDLRLVRDCESYSIGPHTDAPWKVLSYLFYLPPDASLRSLGTSIFLPKDANFRCPGGPHYPFDRFNKIFTAPFVPNSLFAFFKTDYSFHGVEPITIACQRDVLLWNLYDAVARNGKLTG